MDPYANLDAWRRARKSLDVRLYLYVHLLEFHEKQVAIWMATFTLFCSAVAFLSSNAQLKVLAWSIDGFVLGVFLYRLVGRQDDTRIQPPIEIAHSADVHINESVLEQTHKANDTSTWQGVWDNSNERIRRIHRHLAPAAAFLRDALQVKLQEDKDFRNESKVGLCSLPSASPALFKRVDYYTAFLTNGLYRDRIVYSLHGTELPVQVVPRNWACADLSESELANHIGITVLVLDREKKLLLGKPSKKAQTIYGVLAPIGNGSLDVDDIVFDAQERMDIRATLVKGTTREFIEEGLSFATHPRTPINNALRERVRSEVTESSTYIGFWQWLSQGYKPEFVFISQTSADWSDFTPAPDEMLADRENVFPQIRSLSDIDDAWAWAKSNEIRVSVPLYAALSLLSRHWTHQPIRKAIGSAWKI